MINIKEKALQRRFNFTIIPDLLLYQNLDGYIQLEEPEVHFYTGSGDGRGIGSFMDHYSLPVKRYLTQRVKDWRPTLIPHVDNLKQFLEKKKNRRVIVIFTNDYDYPFEFEEFARSMK
jgi:hypothetical protein